MKLIVNADDFGYSVGVNDGVIKAYTDGVLTSTTAMVTMPGIHHAVSLSQLYPKLKIGLHLNITLGMPLTECHSLVKRDGHFYKPKESPDSTKFNEEEIQKEFLAQYELFIELFNRRPTHLDTHLYAHQVYENVQKIAIRFAEEKVIPLRDVQTEKFMRVPFLNWFKVKDGENETDLWDKFLNHSSEIIKNKITELMVHPAIPDEYLLGTSTYNKERLIELEVLIGERMKQFIINQKIELTDFEEASLCLKLK